MSEEKKYITLDEVIDTYISNPIDDSCFTWISTFPIQELHPAVVTEDADFEIIEPKQLPESKK
jgi:hypothetical protein